MKLKGSNYLAAGMVASMLLWGLSWPSAKVLSHYCSVINFSVYRYTVVVFTMLVLLPAGRISYRVRREGWPWLAASGILLALYSYLFFRGVKLGAAGAGGVLVTTMNPVMAYLLGIILSRRLPARNEAIGLLLGVAAGAVLLRIWSNAAVLESGNLYFMLAAFTWALMSKFTSKGAKYGSSMAFSLWQYLITLLCMLPMADFAELKLATAIREPLFWLNLFFGSAIVTAIATTVYFYTTTRLGAEKASSFIFLVPLAAALSSWFLLGETLQWHTVAGGAMGITAVYVMNRKREN